MDLSTHKHQRMAILLAMEYIYINVMQDLTKSGFCYHLLNDIEDDANYATIIHQFKLDTKNIPFDEDKKIVINAIIEGCYNFEIFRALLKNNTIYF